MSHQPQESPHPENMETTVSVGGKGQQTQALLSGDNLSQEELVQLGSRGYVLRGNSFLIQRGRADELLRRTVDPFRRRHLVCFVYPNPDDPDGNLNIATGFLVKYNSQHFIATCGHALHRIDETGVYLGTDSSAIRLRSLMTKATDYQLWDDDENDLDVGAVLIQNPMGVIDAGKSFFDLGPGGKSEMNLVSRFAGQSMEPEIPTEKSTEHGAIVIIPGFCEGIFEPKIVRHTFFERRPSGLLIRRDGVRIDTIAVADLVSYQVKESNELVFNVKYDARYPSPLQVADVTGCSGAPVFTVTGLGAFEGEMNGLTLVGIQFAQTPDLPPDHEFAPLFQGQRRLTAQHIEVWRWLADFAF